MIFLILLLCAGDSLKVKAFDTPNDKGKSITLEWRIENGELRIVENVECYKILRSENGEKYDSINVVLKGTEKYEDKNVKNGKHYWYKIEAISDSGCVAGGMAGPVVSSAQWFHHGRWNVLILSIVFCGLALIFIREAKRGKAMFIRRIAGLEAVDDAVGRATELGRPILYITGLGDMSDIATLASLSILERVAKRTAMHGTPLIIPTYDPVVMSAAQEVVKQAHAEVGRPDTYDESKIFYLTHDQFGYAAGVDGIMLREKPGAIFYQGYFFAEALILAETGNSIGAIQIAGTPATSQLPFFVAACDYTLIGEEMFAASSYLSKEPTMLGSIKGEDWGKVIIIGLIVVGVLIATFAKGPIADSFIKWFSVL